MPFLQRSIKWDFTLCIQFYMHWLCTLVVLNCCHEACGPADPIDNRGMREHNAFAANFVSVYVVICILFQS